MAIKAGLVGLPNVGKSTLFNALTKSSIPAENYPFCTVDPHLAITEVPDKRLEKLAVLFNSKKVIPTTVQFVDIAGLVRGAASGEGLGNQFLSNIFGVDLILHVLRCFEDDDITHVHNTVNPLDDFDVICSELMLKDLESIEKRELKIIQLLKGAKTKNATTTQIKAWEDEQALLANLTAKINAGNFVAVQKTIEDAQHDGIETNSLLCGKQFLIIANLSEDELSDNAFINNKHYQALAKRFGEKRVIPVSAKIESEIAQLPEKDAQEMMESLGITTRGLDTIIKKSYDALGLITFFTCGPQEAHAWSIQKGTRAQQAAGAIHSDLERGFICAEIYNYNDLISLGSEHAVKEGGKLRREGKEYVVTDGDLLNIRFNV